MRHDFHEHLHRTKADQQTHTHPEFQEEPTTHG